MLVLEQTPPGGFGNRMFTYNAVFQIAETVSLQPNFIDMKDRVYFPSLTGNNKYTWFYPRFSTEKLIALGEKQFLERIRLSRNAVLVPPFLGESFFVFTNNNPNKYFKLPTGQIEREEIVGLHFRGGDFFKWNPKAVLSADYYKTAIKSLDNIKSIEMFSDDWALPTINEVRVWALKQGLNVLEHRSKQLFSDFVEMSNCTILISSPSTFAIWAGILGNKKKIIHSTQWLDHCVDAKDKFWVDLRNGGNQFYTIHTEV